MPRGVLISTFEKQVIVIFKKAKREVVIFITNSRPYHYSITPLVQYYTLYFFFFFGNNFTYCIMFIQDKKWSIVDLEEVNTML